MSVCRTGVYCIRNTVNGKRYVGSTAAKTFPIRWADHRRELNQGNHSNARLQSAWRTYGETAFHFDILLACPPLACTGREQHFIDQYRTTDVRYGYNIQRHAHFQRGITTSGCSVEGCTQTHLARGWCRMHYMRWKRHGKVELKKPSAEERFWKFVDKNGPSHPTLGRCWAWTGGKIRRGYGMFRAAAGQIKAHRYAWELHHGPIPDGLCILHCCDNPSCVNPDHLSPGTAAENIADRDRKGRTNKGEDHYLAKLTAEQVRDIRHRYQRDSSTSGSTALAREFGVSYMTILRVIWRRCWKHV